MQEVVRKVITEALEQLGIGEVDFSIEHPSELSHGDYATNVAMVAAKKLNKNPKELAEEIVRYIVTNRPDEIEKVGVAGPGFVNFYLSRDFFKEQIVTITKVGKGWGRNDRWKGKTVIVEYTDPNPFKELHIGHLVPNALGESLARLFMAGGADTKCVTYQGDVGRHVATAIWGLQKLGVSPENITADILGKAYAEGATAYEENEAVQEEIKALNKKIYERTDKDVNALYDQGKKVSLETFEKGYAILESKFERNFFESEVGPIGLSMVKEHVGDVFEESKGAIIFKGEDHGLHTRVFVNSEGLPTYEAKDMGLIVAKNEWAPFDLAITVTGTEQEEYFKVTKKASELIQPDLAGKVELVPNGMLRLTSGKMSSRTGNVVRALNLIDEVKQEALKRMEESGIENREEVAEAVAVAAIKYTILKIAAGKDIVFDLKKSISFEGDSGPYLQYTHARACSVLEKAKGAGVQLSAGHAPEVPYEIERLLYQLPEVIEYSTDEREPHHLVTYLTELAGAFNTFYAKERIADPQDEYAPYKAALTEAVQITLANGLWTLGIVAPERM